MMLRAGLFLLHEKVMWYGEFYPLFCVLIAHLQYEVTHARIDGADNGATGVHYCAPFTPELLSIRFCMSQMVCPSEHVEVT